ncbi:hypothetical protein TWF173_009249 [Orbilia oligospora]|uniref:Uncharacterized protein n=1 Tax=Orbilia oligospora TaxID=2813651 RepID=A0A7C8VII1_ORBOL|nr:hypothetical protein TWF970_007889 [Orbilia oligospora]KAF3310772.1 hypothetical protein TWF173_009249 [Orbilia oligospora]
MLRAVWGPRWKERDTPREAKDSHAGKWSTGPGTASKCTRRKRKIWEARRFLVGENRLWAKECKTGRDKITSSLNVKRIEKVVTKNKNKMELYEPESFLVLGFEIVVLESEKKGTGAGGKNGLR